MNADECSLKMYFPAFKTSCKFIQFLYDFIAAASSNISFFCLLRDTLFYA